MIAATEKALSLYPGWQVGWWRFDDGRCGVEVSRRVAYAQFERIWWSGRSWQEMLEKIT